MDQKQQIALEKKIEFYNMIPNLIWSAIFITPVFIFCYRNMNLKWILIFSAISLMPVFFPKSFFKLFQLGNNISAYKKSGVVFFNRFTQNGAIMNKIIRKKYPNYKAISGKSEMIRKVFLRTFLFEKFHFLLLVFFLFTTIFAIAHGFFRWAFLITVCNVAYNIFPILLQQYIRLRLSLISRSKRR